MGGDGPTGSVSGISVDPFGLCIEFICTLGRRTSKWRHRESQVQESRVKHYPISFGRRTERRGEEFPLWKSFGVPPLPVGGVGVESLVPVQEVGQVRYHGNRHVTSISTIDENPSDTPNLRSTTIPELCTIEPLRTRVDSNRGLDDTLEPFK